MAKKIAMAAGIFLVAAIAAQFVQPDRNNPPEDPAATFEAVARPRPELLSLVKRACYDCHSHRTKWPWYSQISPVSWLVASDVREGRVHLNFSQWSVYGPDMSRLRLIEACEEVKAGNMPLPVYRMAHPEARLTSADIDNLCTP
jgi:hypothetical protein